LTFGAALAKRACMRLLLLLPFALLGCRSRSVVPCVVDGDCVEAVCCTGFCAAACPAPVVCPPVDAGAAEACTVPDAGLPDAGVSDAGAPDSGRVDAGVVDAGIPDAGVHPRVAYPDASVAPVTVTVLNTARIVDPGTGVEAHDMQAFRFADGGIVVDDGNATSLFTRDGGLHVAVGLWSFDDGASWRQGPPSPDGDGVKLAHEFADGEVLAVYRTSFRAPDGGFRLTQYRARSWTFGAWPAAQPPAVDEEAVLDMPLAIETGGDDGTHEPGPLAHHGVVQLPGGKLLMTVYGSQRGDTQLFDAHPESFGALKLRTWVVSSTDRGHTWGAPVLVAYQRMWSRGASADSSVLTYADVPAVTQEGFNEADLTVARNGDVLAVMRSGARKVADAANVFVFPTPLYLGRSCDQGASWAHPIPIADRGGNPNVTTLGNGVVVVGYAQPGSWLAFSANNGVTWHGHQQISTCNDYVAVLPLRAPDELLALYRDDGNGCRLYARRFRVTPPAPVPTHSACLPP